jgi:hypothetical protein
MYVYKRVYIYSPALKGGAKAVFMVWLRACSTAIHIIRLDAKIFRSHLYNKPSVNFCFHKSKLLPKNVNVKTKCTGKASPKHTGKMSLRLIKQHDMNKYEWGEG